jgi:hypothetical protein
LDTDTTHKEIHLVRSLALRQGLWDLGYVEGENLALEYRAALNPGRQVEFAVELAKLPSWR